MIFRVNYDVKTGDIVSYQEGGEDSDNVVGNGCATLSFAAPFGQMFDANNNIAMKVDVKAKQLVFLNPATPPQPIAGA
jgi:hypothetical protein